MGRDADSSALPRAGAVAPGNAGGFLESSATQLVAPSKFIPRCSPERTTPMSTGSCSRHVAADSPPGRVGVGPCDVIASGLLSRLPLAEPTTRMERKRMAPKEGGGS